MTIKGHQSVLFRLISMVRLTLLIKCPFNFYILNYNYLLKIVLIDACLLVTQAYRMHKKYVYGLCLYL